MKDTVLLGPEMRKKDEENCSSADPGGNARGSDPSFR